GEARRGDGPAVRRRERQAEEAYHLADESPDRVAAGAKRSERAVHHAPEHHTEAGNAQERLRHTDDDRVAHEKPAHRIGENEDDRRRDHVDRYCEAKSILGGGSGFFLAVEAESLADQTARGEADSPSRSLHEATHAH